MTKRRARAEPLGKHSRIARHGRWVAAAVIVALSGWAGPAFSQASPPAHDCDRLAAAAGDQLAVGSPVTASRLDAPAAERACREAISRFPEVARFYVQLARALRAQKRHDEALRALRQAIERRSDYPHAIYEIGVHYWAWAVPPHPAEAVTWFRTAADRGHLSAQTALGFAYETGRGVSQDPEAAVRWYRVAAQAGNAMAQYHLGRAHEAGRGVPRDLTEAERLYRLAAEQGHEVARQQLRALESGRGVAAAPPQESAPPATPPTPSMTDLTVTARPQQVRRGETVELEVAYRVSSAVAQVTVRESGTLTFNERVLPSYPQVTERTRSHGRHVTAYSQAIPAKAEPGTYRYEGRVCLAEQCLSRAATFQVLP